ncbi:hypothetical protein EDD37DRAFT_479619 [Exophiala viscosa]|uniref:uncharacterized protein n=1 Tax=Exophiala viscosa TaxID=2486360 RepID=UPI00219F1F81|nr:hypothetical protein EDD37DRAFT_479619 [Exophiala viscosa]
MRARGYGGMLRTNRPPLLQITWYRIPLVQLAHTCVRIHPVDGHTNVQCTKYRRGQRHEEAHSHSARSSCSHMWDFDCSQCGHANDTSPNLYLWLASLDSGVVDDVPLLLLSHPEGGVRSALVRRLYSSFFLGDEFKKFLAICLSRPKVQMIGCEARSSHPATGICRTAGLEPG